MKEIVTNTINRLTKKSTFDEIKRALKEECEKVTFEISKNDWNEMLDEIIYTLDN